MWGQATKGSQDKVLRGQWIRRRYVIQDGYLKPIVGSVADPYNPFDFYKGSDAAIAGRSPYLDLVDLDLGDERAIEAFASQWGLLGIFQHNLIQARHIDGLEPGWEKRWESRIAPEVIETYEWPGTSDYFSSTTVDISQRRLPVAYLSDEFTPAWGDMPCDLEKALLDLGCVEIDSTGNLNITDRVAAQGCVDSYISSWSAARFEDWLKCQHYGLSGSALIRLNDGRTTEVPLADYYEKFFPDLDIVAHSRMILKERVLIKPGAKHDAAARRALIKAIMYEFGSVYPRLASDIFWETLCEPLEHFISEAKQFKDTFDLCTYLSRNERLPHPGDDCTDDAAMRAYLSDSAKRAELRGMFIHELRQVSPLPVEHPGGSGWSYQWSCPSLLSMAYAMMFLDFGFEGRKLGHCENSSCGKAFVSDRADRRFCSERCQNVQKQRDHRARRKAQKEGKDQ